MCGNSPHIARMAKNVRISDDLYALALVESRLQDRSIAQQLEHWAKRGIAASGLAATGGGVDAVATAIAMTRRLDALDVAMGKRGADAAHFISRDSARGSKVAFPADYRKS